MRISIAVLLMVFAAATARAQNTGALFVDGAVLGDRDGTHWTFGPSMASGAGGAIGFRMSNRFSIRFEAEVPAMHTGRVTASYGSTIATDTASFRTATYGALFGTHFQPHRRMDLALLLGLSDAVIDTRFSGYFEGPTTGGVVVRYNEYNSGGTAHSRALSGGADVALRLTPHLSIVPEVRFHTYWDFATVTRTKVAVRWTF
jgi:hypothetical protein